MGVEGKGSSWQDVFMRKLSQVVGGWMPFVLYFGLLSVLSYRYGWGLIWLWLGAVVGAAILGIDHLAYVFVYPHELTSQRVTQLLGSKRFGEAVRLLVATCEERQRLYFRQMLGQVVLLILGFYLLMSGENLLAKGLILSANLGILVQEWRGALGDTAKLTSWLFQNVKGGVSEDGVKVYVFTVTMIFGLLTLLAVRV
jgi:hypothetical protein